MTRIADAVVIGAGINGASIAYNLAKKGCRKVAVLEKYLPASGGTGKSAAIVRQHYSAEVLIKMAMRSRDIFEHFPDVVGGDEVFVKTGYLFFVPPYVLDNFRQNVARQQQLGMQTSIISRDEARSVAPEVDPGDAAGIAYEPDSGYADPNQATASYLARAQELGAQLLPLTPVRSIRSRNGAVEAVRTDKEEFATPVVVNASGPWANVIGSMVGIKYPMRVTREQEVIFRPQAPAHRPNLSVSDMCNAIYLRPFGNDLLVGRGYPKEYFDVDPDNCPEFAEPAFVEEVWQLLAKRAPAMKESMPVRGYSGVYDVTPDWHPIISTHPELKGFVSAVGFSGHGFKLGPAVGEAVSELVLEGESRQIDLSLLDAGRFAAGRLIAAAYGGNRA